MHLTCVLVGPRGFYGCGGAVVVLPGGTPHFHWARSGEYVTQVTAIGPLGLEYVDQKDDPRNVMPPR